MIEASNLGQIVGRLMYGDPAPRVRAEDAAAAAPCGARMVVRRQEGSVAWRIVRFLDDKPSGLPAKDIALATDCPVENIHIVLSQMAEIEKLGKRRHYLYRLKHI